MTLFQRMIETLGGVPGQREREGEGSPIPPAEGGTPKGSAVAMGEHQDLWGLCRLGLRGLSRIVVGETGIPFLENGPERAIERPGSGLQQQVRAALRPLHLLTFGEALADDGVHR